VPLEKTDQNPEKIPSLTLSAKISDHQNKALEQ
jgi:hypothetical protein